MADIEHRHLRSAIEFAVLMAAEFQKRRPPVPFPKELRSFLGKPRVPTGALGRLRRVIEADAEFRRLLSAGALPELVDDVGRLWLAQPEGWLDEATAIVEAAEEESASLDARAELKRAERRRAAAESATARVRVELLARDEVIVQRDAEIEDLRADIDKLTEQAAELSVELVDLRNEVRHARDRERAAADKLTAALAARDEAVSARATAAEVRDDVLAARAAAVASVAEIEAAASEAQSLANRLSSLLPSVGDAAASHTTRPAQRAPMALPGGVLSSSRQAAEVFVRSDAAILVDGYNVAKLAWPSRRLDQQRDALLDAVENLARRFGTDITVVFDGASVVGAHSTRRRLVRVVYSPEGVIADDLIRDEVRRLPTSRSVVVVTDDKEIIRDVRADGANALPSNAFIAVL
ncbi:MAG: NYN domain-containing protein [Ilumatobacter sp.]|jgi:predicted RNA-binding protein with PIN domain/regulator of replication initiation timing|uniref:NYN domain-containing protein n=1 Tax=Ilumatobacter sp. TaxID=1967498 RepID=UPI00391BEA62